MWLTLAAMRNGIAILMASLAIVLLGATSLGRMPIDLFPNLNYPSLQVGTIYKGASAQDIERSVTYPIEKAVSAVANVRYVESRSRQGFSAVTVEHADREPRAEAARTGALLEDDGERLTKEAVQ